MKHEGLQGHDITTELVEAVGRMSYEQMLRRIRFAPLGDVYMNSDTEAGRAFWDRWQHLLRVTEPAERVAASKQIGWEAPCRFPMTGESE